MKHIKHLLVAMISVTYNYLRHIDNSRKDKYGFWSAIRDQVIYFERRGNPYRPLE